MESSVKCQKEQTAVSQETLQAIMTKDHREMTEEEKVIWRQEVLRNVEATTKSSKEVLEKAAETRRSCDKVFKDIKSIEYKWQDLQDVFNERMNKLVEKIAIGLGKSRYEKGVNIAKELFDTKVNAMNPSKAGELIRDK